MLILLDYILLVIFSQFLPLTWRNTEIFKSLNQYPWNERFLWGVHIIFIISTAEFLRCRLINKMGFWMYILFISFSCYRNSYLFNFLLHLVIRLRFRILINQLFSSINKVIWSIYWFTVIYYIYSSYWFEGTHLIGFFNSINIIISSPIPCGIIWLHNFL